MLSAHKKWIAKEIAQAVQHPTYGRLGESKTFRRPGHIAGIIEGVERDQQVEVDVSDIAQINN